MDNARESPNAATEAHRLIAGLRAANQGLRSTPYNPMPDSGPLSNDEVIRQHAIDTGWVVNEQGEAVARVEGWVPPGTPGRREDGTITVGSIVPLDGKPPELPEVLRHPQAPFTIRQEVQPVFGGRGRGFAPGTRVSMESIKGIDVERGVVLVDGFEWPLTDDQQKAAAAFCVQVMVESLQKQVDSLKEDHGLNPPPETQEAEGDSVSTVQEGETGGSVSGASGKAKRKAKVVSSVPASSPASHGGGGGGEAEESA